MSPGSRTSLVLCLSAGLLAACGEPEVASLAYDDIREVAAGKDEATFRSWFEQLRGKRIAWRGPAVEVGGQGAATTLAVDLDGLSGGSTDPDVVFPVSAQFAANVIPGIEVAFTGSIEDFVWQDGRPLLRLAVTEVR
jgi:hypothetical protein